MKATKFTICLLFIMTLFLTSSCKEEYDDSELIERIENLENSIKNPKPEEQVSSHIEISYSIGNEEIRVSEGKTVYIDYTLKNSNENAVVTASSDGNFITKVIPDNINGGRISITGGTNEAIEGYINVMVSDGNGYSFINVINIFKNHIEFSDGMEYYTYKNGGNMSIPFSINAPYTVKIVDGSSWISTNSKSRASMHNETLNINVKQNTSNNDRTAKIQLCNTSDEDDIFAEISITQKWYNQDDEAMILTTSASRENNYISYLPEITGTNICIDWGDGTQEYFTSANNIPCLHRYSTNITKDFDIKITGNIEGLSSEKIYMYTITGIKQWGISRLKHIDYAFKRQPLKSIADDKFGALQDVTTFYETFDQCTSLTSIPQGLFDKCNNVTCFNYTFHRCTSLTSIPQGLFDKCINVTSFYGTFMGCKNLTGESPYTVIDGVKYHLYERSNNNDYFITPIYRLYCFDDCEKLTDYENIPNDWK